MTKQLRINDNEVLDFLGLKDEDFHAGAYDDWYGFYVYDKDDHIEITSDTKDPIRGEDYDRDIYEDDVSDKLLKHKYFVEYDQVSQKWFCVKLKVPKNEWTLNE